MADISHTMGGDLSWGPTGDLAQVAAPDLTTERVLRRLLTNPGDYIWQLDYGGGLGRMIGIPANPPAIAGIIRSQMLQEASVANSPAPQTTVSAGQNGVVVATVQYADAATGTEQVLYVPIS
jgi:phage baseplate assembly protein W